MTLTPTQARAVSEIRKNLDLLILSTPSGDLRNKICDINILFMIAIAEELKK